MECELALVPGYRSPRGKSGVKNKFPMSKHASGRKFLTYESATFQKSCEFNSHRARTGREKLRQFAGNQIKTVATDLSQRSGAGRTVRVQRTRNREVFAANAVRLESQNPIIAKIKPIFGVLIYRLSLVITLSLVIIISQPIEIPCDNVGPANTSTQSN